MPLFITVTLSIYHLKMPKLPETKQQPVFRVARQFPNAWSLKRGFFLLLTTLL